MKEMRVSIYLKYISNVKPQCVIFSPIIGNMMKMKHFLYEKGECYLFMFIFKLVFYCLYAFLLFTFSYSFKHLGTFHHKSFLSTLADKNYNSYLANIHPPQPYWCTSIFEKIMYLHKF